jgi:hypothetical protein
MLFKSRNHIQLKTKCNVNVVSSPKFHVLSNGALVFALSLILCTGKWIQLFTDIVLAFSLHFQHIGLTGKPSAPFARA